MPVHASLSNVVGLSCVVLVASVFLHVALCDVTAAVRATAAHAGLIRR